VQRAWALFQAEQLSRAGRHDLALAEFQRLGKAWAGEAGAQFELARAAARCALLAMGAGDLADLEEPLRSNLEAPLRSIRDRFIDLSLAALEGAVEAGFQDAGKFCDEELDIVRTSPLYGPAAKAFSARADRAQQGANPAVVPDPGAAPR